MIPSKLSSNIVLEDELRYLAFMFDESQAPRPDNLRRIGQLVMESVIADSSAMVAGRRVRFSVVHYQEGEPVKAKSLADEMAVPRPCSDNDEIELLIWVNVNGEDHDYIIYDGKSFDELWAVWSSWMSGAKFLIDMAELDKEKRHEEENG